MASSIVINILGNASNFIGATQQAQSAMDKFGAKAGRIGLAMAGALGVAATAAVKSAADQSAAVAAWTQVTGKQMDAQQKTIARSLNLSQTDYAKSYTKLSSLYQSNGIAQAKANEMAAKGLKLAADQAAFGNTTVGEAVEAQAGLLKGSGELLEKYSVSITAADVAARMKADGTDKLTGAEKKAATAVAKANLVQEQSAKFLGQAARESNSLESRQQRLTATVEDFKAKMGQQLLPVVEQFIGKLQTAAEWIEKNETKTKIAVGVLAGFAAVLLTVSAAIKTVRAVQAAWNAVMIATNVIMFANPIVLVTAAVVALGAAVFIAYKKSETFRNGVQAVMKLLRNAVLEGVRFVVDKFLWFAETIVGAGAKAFGWVPGIGGKLKKAHAAIKQFRDDTNRTLDGLKDHSISVFLQTYGTGAVQTSSGAAVSQGGGTIQGRYGGMRAWGGPVTAGVAYTVGERGRELFVPKTDGTVVPNHALAGGGPDVLELHLDLGHGIKQVIDINLREHDRAIKRTRQAGGRRVVTV